jgi:hypothetical protein
MGYMESPNLVASCATETKAILPNLICVQWDSAWATHDMSVDAYTRKTCTRVRWALIVSLTASWTVATRGVFVAHVCHVVRFYPLQGVLLIRLNLHDTLGYGWGLFAAPKYSNYTFIMLYLVHETDINSLVVDEIINIKIVWSQLHAQNRMQTYDANYLNLANNMVKSI